MKDIPGYEGKYAVTPDGRVWSYKTKKFLAITVNKTNGYCYVGLWKDNHNKTIPVHRLVALLYVANPDVKPVVNHKNGIKTDNHYMNLEWVTKLENEDHARRTGLRTYTNRLTKDQFVTLLWDVIKGESYFSISKRVNYQVPFLSTKIRKIAKEMDIVHLLDISLKEQRIKRANKNLESINNYALNDYPEREYTISD